MRGCGMTNPIVRKRIEVKEPFVGSPANADAPALLLADTLSPIENPSVKDSLTSQRCFEADFQTRLEHAGSYRQMTNNYRREGPDSCSAPLHDLLLHFYRVVPLP